MAGKEWRGKSDGREETVDLEMSAIKEAGRCTPLPSPQNPSPPLPSPPLPSPVQCSPQRLDDFEGEGAVNGAKVHDGEQVPCGLMGGGGEGIIMA